MRERRVYQLHGGDLAQRTQGRRESDTPRRCRDGKASGEHDCIPQHSVAQGMKTHEYKERAVDGVWWGVAWWRHTDEQQDEEASTIVYAEEQKQQQQQQQQDGVEAESALFVKRNVIFIGDGGGEGRAIKESASAASTDGDRRKAVKFDVEADVDVIVNVEVNTGVEVDTVSASGVNVGLDRGGMDTNVGAGTDAGSYGNRGSVMIPEESEGEQRALDDEGRILSQQRVCEDTPVKEAVPTKGTLGMDEGGDVGHSPRGTAPSDAGCHRKCQSLGEVCWSCRLCRMASSLIDRGVSMTPDRARQSHE